ncbi:Calcium-independent phospholipase A2-gamma [Fusarium austroafricanum]|uniref:Calcium-independent phospholipase A2-gamma n=1 Tax=Fusarium austroafricanum TaxID=2364996 RepID=A0A8H4KRK6_9HYPO|nr:Calcium-independent phospholipase A2-gamma [Fusarium austroafricanum]
MVHTPTTKHANGARLLAIDGGGVRGIMALEALKVVMEHVRAKKGIPEEKQCRPAEYSELASGTSTGGIIGIMLFLLRMTAQQAIDQYEVFAEQVFSPKIYGKSISWMSKFLSSPLNNSKTLVQSSRFHDQALKKAIDDVVALHGLDDHDQHLKGKAPLQHEDAGPTVLLRSYEDNNIYTSTKTIEIMDGREKDVTISIAACATSAAPTYFPEVIFPEGTPKHKDDERLVFWDGGLLNNNPLTNSGTRDLNSWSQTNRRPPLPALLVLLVGVAAEVMEFSTNTDAKAKDFTRHMKTLNKRGAHKNTRYMAELKGLAQSYIEGEGKDWIDEAVDAICA